MTSKQKLYKYLNKETKKKLLIIDQLKDILRKKDIYSEICKQFLLLNYDQYQNIFAPLRSNEYDCLSLWRPCSKLEFIVNFINKELILKNPCIIYQTPSTSIKEYLTIPNHSEVDRQSGNAYNYTTVLISELSVPKIYSDKEDFESLLNYKTNAQRINPESVVNLLNNIKPIKSKKKPIDLIIGESLIKEFYHERN